MSSEQLLRVNRENARKSTGPKTCAGKKKSSRNAVRHGLGAIRFDDSLLKIRVTNIVSIICGNNATLFEQQLAETVAECQIALGRIRTARAQAIERWRIPKSARSSNMDLRLEQALVMNWNLARASRLLLEVVKEIIRSIRKSTAKAKHPVDPSMTERLSPEVGSDRVSCSRSDLQCFLLALPELLAIERYEKRILSRRHKALEALRCVRAHG